MKVLPATATRDLADAPRHNILKRDEREMNLDLTTQYYGNELGLWIVAAALGIAVLVALYIIRRAIGRRLHSVDVDLRNDWAEAVYISVIRGGTWLPIILVSAIYAATYVLDLTRALDMLVDRVIVMALLLQAALWGTRFVSVAIAEYTRKRRATDPSSASGIHIVSVVARGGLWAVVALLILDNLGIDITALVAGLGIGGIAVALAAQNILGDLFSSLSIVLDKPFEAGDFIIFGAEMGTIERIGIKTTRVRSLTGEEIVVSNSDLLSARIRNYRRMDERRGQFLLGVEYGTSADKLERIPQIVCKIIDQHPNARFDRSHFKEYGDFSLNFETVYYVKSSEYQVYADTAQDINLAIYRAFAEEGIEFAFPTQTLHVIKQADEPQAS